MSRRQPALGFRSRLFDAFVAVLAFAVGVRAWIRGPFGQPHWLLVVGLGMSVALLWRRRYPATVFAVVAAFGLAQLVGGVHPSVVDAPVLVATYSVAAYGARPRAVTALVVDWVGATAAASAWGAPNHFLLAFVAGVGGTGAIWAAGDSMRSRRAYLAGLEERAARLEAERDAQAALAAATERTRIAREMHDVVAHSLSVIIAQADGATYAFDTTPERARAAMQTVAETGRTALAEMRRLLGVLRDEPGRVLAPQPGVERLGELVAQMRSAGLVVRLTETGDGSRLGEGLSLTVYRLVQEALTNVLKHAGVGARVQVDARYAADGVTLDVTDDGGPGAPAAAADGRPDGADGPGGHGLAGMRERATLYGGSLVAGPVPGGGWRVSVRLGALVRVG